jgi:hypothetical protein
MSLPLAILAFLYFLDGYIFPCLARQPAYQNLNKHYEITFILNILPRIIYNQENILTPCGIYVISFHFTQLKHLLQTSIHKKTHFDFYNWYAYYFPSNMSTVRTYSNQLYHIWIRS